MGEYDGRFVWYELMTPDPEGAKAFYEAVVGWQAADQGSKDLNGSPYLIIEAGGRGVGGMLRMGEQMREHGARPGWVGYINVEDVDATLQKVERTGGKVLMPRSEIPNVGPFAMIADPGGAAFYVMAPTPAEGVEPPPPPGRRMAGHVDWHELYTAAGQEQTFAFYAELFGWRTHQQMEMGPMGIYRIFGYRDGEDQWGGMMDKPPHVPVSAWTFYIYLDGIDAAAERVKANGGQLVMGPMEVPDGSFVLQGFDPQGALFALVSKTR